MYQSKTNVRVRYAETDQMGVVYYGVYSQYFEVGRVEALRELGMTYREMEEKGTMLPVSKLEVKYIRPATYDELLTVVSEIREMPGARIRFYHSVFNQSGQLLTTGSVELVFVDHKTLRPHPAPEDFLKLMKPFFEDKS